MAFGALVSALSDAVQRKRAEAVELEYLGVWGDIYIDNMKRKVLGSHESAADEGNNIRTPPIHYDDSPFPEHANAPGVHANGLVVFENLYGYVPLTLNSFTYVNS